LLKYGRTRRAVEVAEKHADGLVNDAERREAHEAACDAARSSLGPAAVYAAAFCGTNILDEDAFVTANNCATFAVQSVSSRWDAAPVFAECEAQCNLLADIFGNPFRPVILSPAVLTWNDGVVVRLAQAAYEERHLPEGTLDKGRLAVFADALEEAGCTDTDILGHLRGPGPHVRGCWVIDKVLGKS
jgi:hypothetical protein